MDRRPGRIDEDILMPAPTKTYQVVYSEGNELDLTQVNELSGEGWDLEQFVVVKGEGSVQAKFAYVMSRTVTI